MNSSCCGESNLRISFSKLWTSINCFVSTIVMASPINIVVKASDESPYVIGIILHIIGVICTVLFLLFDHISCCCCDCWRGQQEVVVYDPDHPEASLVWRDGEVVDIGLEKTSNDVVEINP